MERSQASQKEPDRGDLDQHFTAGGQALIIASQASVADQPAKGAFHFPALSLYLEPAFRAGDMDRFSIDENPGVRFGNNLGLPAQMCLDPVSSGPV
ncbi:MAG TPA: hypothetical protein VFV38_20245 [Ktedonobacteraceae bacterium]|nr:hypothetical protein [Ktedonobacteraceae bacterium]